MDTTSLPAPPHGAVDGPAWRALQAHAARLAALHLRELFAADPARGTRYAAEAAGLYLDYAKQRIDETALAALIDLAREAGLAERIDALFTGARVNTTEQRPALHTALRAPSDAVIRVDGHDVMPEIQAVLARMRVFADAIRSGAWRGHTGRPMRAVVNLGIGGSDLGPVMAAQALRPYATREIDLRFVSNVDGADLAEALRGLDPAQTLFIVASKTFTTLETMSNARSARDWLVAALGDEAAVARHFVALSTNAAAVAEFGIAPESTFGFWDWVGGRYSMLSAIGLSTMIAVGPERFDELRAGARAMDEHFRRASLEANLPVLHALLAVWNTNFLGAETLAVLPYEQHLRRFPAYLQQLVMESNGKRVRADGLPVACDTAPIVWGEPGTNGQHSFHQLLHQGTRHVACDFIVAARSAATLPGHHALLVANALAQSEALAFGLTEDELRAAGSPEALLPHRACLGNRPSNTLLIDELTPAALGALVALYEHSTYVQSVIWGIDAFDQWGVELGKRLASRLTPALQGEADLTAFDSSTRVLLERLRSRAAGS